MMNDNPIIIESDSKGNASYSRRGMKCESQSFSYVSGDFKPEIIPLIDDSKTEGIYGESLSDRAPCKDSSETLFLEKLDRGGTLVEKPMSPPVLSKEEIEVAHHRREHVGSFIKTYREVTSYEPSDGGISRHLEC